MHVARVLLINAGLQVFVSSILGFVMLLPMQPWAPAPFKRLPPPKALLPVHLDLYMLAFMQALAAVAMIDVDLPRHAALAAGLLIFGGWMNPLPYLFRIFKVNAFVFGPGGGLRQWAAAGLAGLSALGIVAAWAIMLMSWLFPQ